MQIDPATYLEYIATLSSAKKRYLFTIYELAEGRKEIYSKDIALSLNVKPPSASKMLGSLAEDGFIQKESYSKIRLTKKGEELGYLLYTNYRLLYAFFANHLNVSHQNARKDALLCLSELSDASFQRITAIVSEEKASGQKENV